MKKSAVQSLHLFMAMASQPGFERIFGGDPEERSPYEKLGNGYELRPIEMLAEGGQFVVENREKYSHLYHNGEKVTDLVFRKGGMGGNFKDGYCSLIHYTQREPHTEQRHGFDFGTHVIINHLGEIRLSGDSISSYPSHSGGNLGKLKDTYYDLRTGEEVITVSSSGGINSKNFIFAEHRYDWYNKNLPLGVYKIDKQNCTIELIDQIK